MTDKKKPDKEARLQRVLHRLGCNNPACCICGENNPLCLDEHHIAGRKNDPEPIGIVCANHHRILTDAQKDHPQDIQDPEDDFGRIGHCMVGLACMLEAIAPTLRRYSEILFEHTDIQYPKGGDKDGNA